MELVTEATWLSVADSDFCPFSPGPGHVPPVPLDSVTVCIVCILRNQHKHKHSILKLRREHCYCSVAQSCPTL